MLARSVRAKRSLKPPSDWLTRFIVATPESPVEIFDCDADGYPMEGLWVQRLNERGLINDLTGYLRLYPAVTVLRNRTKELGGKIGVLVGHDYWELSHPAV